MAALAIVEDLEVVEDRVRQLDAGISNRRYVGSFTAALTITAGSQISKNSPGVTQQAIQLKPGLFIVHRATY
jgi:hypothetical protein